MSMQNPYNKYSNNNKVFTVPKEELTLILFDAAVKFSNQAIIAMENGDNDKINQFIVRAQNIVREFQLTLDKQYEISGQLDELYEYIYTRLIEANVKKDIHILTECRDMIRDLRNTWKEAMSLAKKK